MAKTLTGVQQAEYDQLKSFLAVVCDGVLPKDPLQAAHPLVVLDGLYQRSPARALRGLREAAHDMVEATEHVSDKELAALEALLVQAGAPSLRAMRERRSRAIFAILERGAIQSDDEWRLISGALSDTDDRLLSGLAREIANDVVGRYERAKVP